MIRRWNSPTGRMGWPKADFQRLPPTSEEIARLRAAWRAQHPKIVALWADLERRIVP